MALTFPAPYPDGRKSIRFYKTGNAAVSFAANSWLFSQPDDSTKQAWSNGIRLTAGNGASLEFSFDGTNVHVTLENGDSVTFYERYEGGIAVRGSGVYYIEAW